MQADCGFYTNKCDINTHECDFYELGLIFTHRVCFKYARVWFMQAKCDFHTQKCNNETHECDLLASDTFLASCFLLVLFF
jgi:hypothetical protein